ncbi:MAG: heparinase II/III-family protein [Treponemataceae bacterium]|nr:heparinase II/III-family protein [Treponemataceae bacterium]
MFEELLDKLPKKLASFQPYPSASCREKWQDSIDPQMRERILKEAATYMDYSFPPIPATLFMDFCRTGNRVRFEDVYFTRRNVLNLLVLAECLEYKGRFLDGIINGIFALCEESAWQLPAHNSYIRDTPQSILPDATRPLMDLFACETACQLSVIEYLLKDSLDSVSPAICRRIESELSFRIFTPYLTQDFWWMGYNGQSTNNWTIWCTQNVLIAAFLGTEKKLPDEKLLSIVSKAAYSIDRFLESYKNDGCCTEGAQYYRHAGLCLLNAMDILSVVSDGVYGRLFTEQKIKNIAEFIVKVHISGDYYFNFADCATKAGLPGVREFLFGKACGSPRLMKFAAEGWKSIYDKGGIPYVGKSTETLNLYYHLQELFNAKEMLGFGAADAVGSSSGMGGSFLLNSAFSDTGLYISRCPSYQLAVKAGNNDDSHNHNDVGSFILFKEGAPFIIDIGVETYSKKTFSPDRYEIWTMQSLFHNVTNFCRQNSEGKQLFQQLPGKEYKAEVLAYKAEPDGMSISMELKDAYDSRAGVGSYVRQIIHAPDSGLIVTDRVAATAGTQPFLCLMTAVKPELVQKEAGKLVFSLSTATANAKSQGNAGPQKRGEIPLKAEIRLTGSDLDAFTCEEYPVTDPRLQQSWSGSLYRLKINYTTSIKAVFA